MTTQHTPVLIVGAGAAGLATAALLAKYGVESLVVEKRREVFRYPKARNLSFRTLEILRGLGLGDVVHSVGADTPDMVVRPALNSPEELPALDLSVVFAGLHGLSPEPVIQYCPQSRLEPILARHTRSHGGQVRYGTELVTFDQDADGVSATLRDIDSGQISAVRCDYLVAADGVHSRIRGTLGISTSGHDAIPIYVVFVYFRGPGLQFVSDLGDGASVQVKNADVDGIFVPTDDADLYLFIMTYFPQRGQSADDFTEQRCRDLVLAAVGEPIDIEIIDIAPWQPYERVADAFSCGRAFLVGDAAHAMPPFRAGGANAAIQSADNLAWKLAAVLQGRAGTGLLDTYHDERHPVGAFSSRQSLTGPVLALLDFDPYSDLDTDEEQPMFALLVGYQYRSAAVISDHEPTAKPLELVTELRGQPGTRLPHVWLDGGRTSTLDLIGTGFALLTADDPGPWKTDAEDIAVQTISADDRQAWLDATGLQPGGALLVRPDAFVAWRTETLPPDPAAELSRALTTVLAR